MLRAWEDLGVVEAIYEEHEEASNSSKQHHGDHPLSPLSSLNLTVQSWSQATGLKTDVVVHVQNQSFHLHKEPLRSRSGFLKRHLKVSSQITLESSSKIAAETFAVVVDFCYGSDIVITPLNVAALRCAAEYLEIADEQTGDRDLGRVSDHFFSQAVSSGRERAVIVFRATLGLLPEAEEKAFLVSRCIEALVLLDNDDKLHGVLTEFSPLTVDNFERVVSSMQRRFNSDHDLLYRIVESYLKEHEELSQEQKNRLCNFFNCGKLSPALLMHAIQNQNMPLRFLIEAMFLENLKTRHSLLSIPKPRNDFPLPLGTILHRDNTFRQISYLKATMEATRSKIKMLEEDLISMKEYLNEYEKRRRDTLNSIKSESFRFSSKVKEPFYLDSVKNSKGFSQMLVKGLKIAFKKSGRDFSLEDVPDGNGDGLQRRPLHCRHNSFS